MSDSPHKVPPAILEIERMLQKAKDAQLAGEDRRATYWHWQLVKYARRARDPRTKAAAYAAAAYYHGFVAYRDHQYAKAETLFRHALTLGLRADWTYMNAGCAIRDQGRVAEALEYFQQAATLSPESVQPLVALGNAAYELGNADAAALAWGRALSRTTTDPAAVYDQAILSMLLGQYEVGWQLHRARWHAPLFKAAHRPPPSPDWDGAPTDARVMLFAEQGNGDAIMLLRWLPWARERAPHAVLCIHKPLVRLCQTAWPDLEVHPLEAMPWHDAKLSLFDLPAVAGCRGPEDFPAATILQAPPGPEPRLAFGQKNVGLVWAGGTQTHHDWRRSVPWEVCRPLLEVPGCHFVAMQIDRLEALTAEDRARMTVAHEVEPFADFGDTARWLEGLDLLISVDTGIAHLAGALGVPCWMPTPRLPDYRWGLLGDETPWYPWHRLYRQEVAQDWASVLVRLKADLETWAEHHQEEA